MVFKPIIVSGEVTAWKQYHLAFVQRQTFSLLNFGFSFFLFLFVVVVVVVNTLTCIRVVEWESLLSLINRTFHVRCSVVRDQGSKQLVRKSQHSFKPPRFSPFLLRAPGKCVRSYRRASHGETSQTPVPRALEFPDSRILLPSKL